jgi:excisionase family DNA binding protein
MTSDDVAELLGVARSTVAEWARRGRIPCRRISGTRRFLFSRVELERYVDEGGDLETTALAEGGCIVKPRSAKWKRK